MTTWIAFLRAINLGAHRKFPKGNIVAATEQAGANDVATYINTGNVRLDHPTTDRAGIEAALEAAYLADRGFEVPTICVSPTEMRRIAADAAELAHDGRHYVSLLKEAPSAAAIATIESASTESERAIVRDRAVHLLLAENYRQAKLTNVVVERTLGVATNRNLNVIRALAERWT